MKKIKFKDYRDIEEKTNEDEMSPTSKYRRSIHPLKPGEDEELRPHFRIIKCCLNCKYHFACGPNPSRMGCYYPYTAHSKAVSLEWPGGKELNKEFLLLLTPTHASCCCNSHKFKTTVSGKLDVGHVTKYCGAEYLGDDDYDY